MPTHPPPEEPDLERVRAYFQDRSLSTARFSQEETQRQRTPDFKVLRRDELVAYCEVKSPYDPWLDGLVDNAAAGEVVGGTRSDPIFNRLSRHISTAAMQFRAVNSDRSSLNILAFVNHDSASHIGDLVETLTGKFVAADGEHIPTMPHMVDRLCVDRIEIDVYLWFCVKNDRLVGYFVTPQDGDPRLMRVCELLQINPEFQRI
jgi:hypothetical protein